MSQDRSPATYGEAIRVACLIEGSVGSDMIAEGWLSLPESELIAKALRAYAPSETAFIDLEADFWQQIKAAAKASPWMPPEYMMNDWVSDLCSFLQRRVQTGESALSATPFKPVGLFWQTSDRRWHFSPGSTKRGDIHDNGRPIHIAYLGEEAARE